MRSYEDFHVQNSKKKEKEYTYRRRIDIIIVLVQLDLNSFRRDRKQTVINT